MQLIQECRTSGLSDREWCSQNGIPVSTFYYHIKRLREQACDIPASVSRKAAVRQEVVRLDIIDELPGTINNSYLMYTLDYFSFTILRSSASFLTSSDFTTQTLDP